MTVSDAKGNLSNTMPPQMNCPACGSDMRSRSLLSYHSLQPYRVCPDCNARYTADRKTKLRQVPIIILALISLGLTAAGALIEPAWLLPAVFSYFVLLVYVGYVVSKVSWVQYHN